MTSVMIGFLDPGSCFLNGGKRLRVVIRVTDTEADLSGTPAELRAIGEVLSGMVAGQSCLFAADPTADPAPYDRVLTDLQAVASDGPLRVSVAGSKLVVEGSPAKLTALASWFQFPDTASPGNHGHYEWDPGNPHIAQGSLPLVVSVA